MWGVPRVPRESGPGKRPYFTKELTTAVVQLYLTLGYSQRGIVLVSNVLFKNVNSHTPHEEEESLCEIHECKQSTH